MKKAFPFRKKLSAALAVALAVACFAGAAPADAAESGYAHSIIGSYGTFENYMWHLSDNTSGDTLSFNAENQPVVTKGSGADGLEATSLGSRSIELAAGRYQLSFSIKSSSQASYIVDGYGFNSSGDPKALRYEGITSATVGTDWTAVTASFEATEGFTSNEFRIILRGNAGTQITVKDFDVKAMETAYVYEPSTAGWDGTYKTGETSANSYIEAVEEGYSGVGSIHIYQYGANQRYDRNIYYSLGGLTVGKSYTLKFAVKGDTGKNDVNNAMNIELAHSNSSNWALTGNTVVKPTGDYTDWEELSYDFTANNASLQIRFNTSKYGQIDCYIDDVSVCEKDGNGTNLISNGTFSAPKTTLDGWKLNEGANPLWGNVYYNPNYDDFKIETVAEGNNGNGAVHFLKKKSYTFDDGISRKSARIVSLTMNDVMSKYPNGTTFVFKADVKGSVANEDPMKITFDGSGGNYYWNDNSQNYHDLIVNAADWQSVEYKFTMEKAGNFFLVIRTGGYTITDLYLDNIAVYAESNPTNNLISNSTFCETESVVSSTSAVDNSAYRVQNVPGFDIGMLNDTLNGNKDIFVVPGGSYDGSTAVKIRAYGDTANDKQERYFQTAGNTILVKGDLSVKVTGYFKVTEGETEPKIWIGFGKSYNGKSSVGLHYANYLKNGKPDSGEAFVEKADGWVYFEKAVDKSDFKNAISDFTELTYITYCCGIDARENRGSALFDNVTCEIISSAAPGDTNGDDSIDIRDLVHMKKYAAGTVGFTEMTRGTWLSDIGYSEKPSVTNEMVSMRKYLIGAISEYGK